ncbi:MAG: hypothetical protein WC236_14705 [Gallionellaceae bacterium]|jgi:hypothetical protein
MSTPTQKAEPELNGRASVIDAALLMIKKKADKFRLFFDHEGKHFYAELRILMPNDEKTYRRDESDKWQPIETVPRSGNVLIFVPDNAEGERVLSASFARIEHPKSLVPKFVFYLDGFSPGSDPEVYGATRWMPLPDEPINK